MRRQSPKSEATGAAEHTRRLLCERTADAVAVLVQLMQDEGQKPELRMKAAESILDRVCGKAASGAMASGGEEVPTSVCLEGVLEEWSQ